MATYRAELARVAGVKGLGGLSYRTTHTDTGYRTELYLGKQVYYSERPAHEREASAEDDAAEAALRCLRLEETEAHVDDVDPQLCRSLQRLDISITRPTDYTDSAAVALTYPAVVTSNISGNTDGSRSDSKARCTELLSQCNSLPASYSVVRLTSDGLENRFQATVNFRLNCVATSGAGASGKRPAEQKAAEQALRQLNVPLRGSGAKSTLNEWAQGERRQIPRYHSYNAGQEPGVYYAVVYCDGLPVRNVALDLTGDVCPNKPEAEQTAAERVVSLVNALQPTDTNPHQGAASVSNVDPQLCRSLQQLDIGKTWPTDYTDSAAAALTCPAVVTSNISGNTGGSRPNSKARCTELLSQCNSLPASYSVVRLTSEGLENRFQATVNFRLNCVATSGAGASGKRPAEQKAAEQALRQLNIPLRGSSAKSTLNEWAQGERLQIPRYHSYNAGQEPGVYYAVVYCDGLPVRNVGLDLTGDVCPNEREAEQSAAERVVSLVNALQPTDTNPHQGAASVSNVDPQLCRSLQRLDVGNTRPTDYTDSAAAALTCPAVVTSNISGNTGGSPSNSKARCTELLSQCNSLPASYSVVKLTGLDNRFQAAVNFRLNCVATSGEGVSGKRPAEQKAAEQALRQLNVPLRGSSAKSTLNEWAQRERHQVPRYHSYNAGQDLGVYCAVVYCDGLPVRNVALELIGDVCQNKPEAEQSAAERVVSLVNALQPTDTNPHKGVASVSKCSPNPTASVNIIRSPSRETENCYDVLCKHCQKLQLPVPTALFRPSANGEDDCVINMSYRFCEKPQRPHMTKKEAEKAVAQYVLNTAFADSTPLELNQSKNRLQEKCQKLSATAVPQYDTVATAGGLFSSTVIVALEFSQTCGKDHKTAKHNVAKTILRQLDIDY